MSAPRPLLAMRFALFLAALAAPACAQAPADSAPPADKPAATADLDRQRRADSVVTRPAVASGVTVDTVVVEVGSLPVRVVTHSLRPEAQPAFWAVNLHDDESTSVDAALAVAAEAGGIVVELVHTGDRNLGFRSGGRTFGADPNRIFTPAGRARTLAALTDGESAPGDPPVERLADHILTETGLAEAAVVVTLHNNTDGRYSAGSYLPGNQYATDAEAVTIHDGSDPDDFFFVTDRALYEALVARGFNAVLQDNDSATDDGSLSVWAAQNDRPYVNVEAQHGHLQEQTRMIRALVEVLAEREGSR